MAERSRLMEQLEKLLELWDDGTCRNNEWYSVGMEPPKENVNTVKALSRKIGRLNRQLGLAAEF